MFWKASSMISEVAAKHYLQVTDDHFQMALQPAGKALQNALQQAHETPCRPARDLQGHSEENAVCSSMQGNSWNGIKSQKELVGVTGLEPVTSRV